MEIQVKKIDNLIDNQKVYLTHKIFDYWLKGNIKNNDKVFLPEDLNIYNSKDVSKVFLICSKIKSDEEVESIYKHFKKLNFYEKLDFMIYLFDNINEIQIVPTYITYNINFKNLSDKIVQYKLNI